MTKKSLNKLLSVILTLAICSAAVFGCLITANATDVTCYEWSEGVVSKDLTSATIDLTLTAPSSVLPDGMAAAQLGFTADEGLVLNSVAVKGGVPTSGAFDAADFEALEKGADGKYLIDVKTADKYYTSVVLTLTYGFTGGTATAGAKYNVRVAANSLTMFDAFDNEFNYTGTGTAGVIKTGCDHIFDVIGLTPVTTNTVEGYRVYTNVKCKNCGIVNPYQVVPATELKSVIYWDGSTKTEPTVQDADGNYTISTAAELAWIVSQTAESATSGKSYKVADGIDAIVLQPESDKAKAIMDLADYAQTKAYFDAFGSKVKWVTTHDNCFAGNFDGNGVEIYGLYGNAANGSKGVFGKIKPGITLKNFAVKNSYILNGDHKVGAVFGAPSSTINDAFITVEKVIVSGCYISSNLPISNGNVWNVGVMAGTSIGAGYGVVIKNCLVYNNIAVNTADATVNYGLVGKLSDTQRNRVQNSIILDCVPYSLADDQANPTVPVVFENVYTNAIDYELSKTWPAAVVKGNASWASYADKIISINRSDVFGSKVTTACPALFTAGSPWQADLSGGYPTFDNTVATVATDIVVYGGGAGVAPKLLDESSENSESNPYIIATAENLLYIVKEGAASSAGKYYKVADNVKAFVLQPKDRFTAKGATVEDLMNLDAAGVMEWFDDPNKTVSVTSENKFGNDFKANWTINGTSVKWQNWNKYGDAAHAFQGTFDGNGATVYGLVSQGGVVGLFGRLKGATIKNVNVKGSYGVGYEGGMLGSTGWYSGWENDLKAGLLSNRIENCTVTNSVIISCRVPGSTSNTAAGGDSYTSTGLLCGNFANGDLAVNNCLVSGNIGYNFIYDRGDGKTEAETLGATITDTYNYANGNTLSMIGSFRNNAASVVSNCISIGQYAHVSPKHNWDNNGGRPASFSNVYTDKPTTAANGLAFANNSTISYSASQIKQIGVASFEGNAAVTACAGLDWTNGWIIGSGNNYPSPVQTGATLNRSGKTIYWDGTQDTTLADNGEAGTAEDPIIIDSAEELAGLVATAKANNTAGKYFKLADNIGTIVLQPAGNEAILGLADAAAVKAHFESGASFKEWIQTSWEGTSFCGTFDGNGVEIYGMYQKTDSREQGLFPEVEGGAVLKNFALKNSYVTTTSLNYATAFISARSNNSGYGAKVDGIITFDHIALVNNYMRRDVDNFARVGLFTGEMNSDTALVKNCLVAGNDAKYTKDSEEYDVALLASCKTDMTYTDDMTEMNKNGNFVCYTVKDSIFLGSPAYNIKINGWRNSSPFCYSNVYSDTMPTLTIGSVQTFTDAQIKLVNAADLVGSGAQDVVTALNDANGSTVWYTGNEFDGYPSLEPAGTLPSSYQSAYEAVEFTSYNSYTGSNDQFGLYTTSLNLKNNPYMSLVFAFGKEGETDYKANRANISVTVTGASGTIYSGNVPAYVEGEFISGVNGWTNKKNAGRYHTLKLNAPISDLAGELTVTINYNNGEKVITNKVSVSGFGNELINSYKKNPSDYYLNCAEAVKALLFYTQSVQKVYGSK